MGQVQVLASPSEDRDGGYTRDGPGDVWTGLAQCDAL